MKLFLNITFHPQINGHGVLNQYFKNYVNIDKKNRGEHLGLAECCYNFIMHLVNKMSLFELTLRKEANKPMDLAIPMGQRDHSEEVVDMVQGCEELYARTKKLFIEQAQNGMKNMLIKHENMWSLKLNNIVAKHPRFKDV